MHGFAETFWVALRLGLTSFGGPSAHIGYFRKEYVERRGWLTDEQFAELVAVVQFLPGPSSSQLGATIGYSRARWSGAVGAWLGFTAPSAAAMAAFAAVASRVNLTGAVWLHALKLVAVAIVADAVLSMARTLANTARTASVAVAVAAVILLLPTSGLIQLGVLAVGSLAGLVIARGIGAPAGPSQALLDVSRRAGVSALTLFGVLFGAVVAARGLLSSHHVSALAAGMFRSGALVFGGGHVVLPLLQAEAVPRLVTPDEFLAGYGAAQAMPGPLFTFASFLGQSAAGIPGAVVATVAIFLPGMLLTFGVMPFWAGVRARPRVRAALVGVNAAVVGLLAAALVDPIGTGSVHGWLDLAYAVTLFLLLRVVGARPIVVVAVALAASPLLLLV